MVTAGAGQKIGIVASSRLTNEDAFAVLKLKETLGVEKLSLLRGEDDPRPFAPSSAPLSEWLVREDKSPNSRGTQEVLGETLAMADMVDAVEAGEVTCLLVFGADPAAGANGAGDALKKLDLLVAVASHQTETTALAHVVMPESSPFEKEGTFKNEGGCLQKLSRVLAPAGDSRASWQWAGGLAKRLGAKWSFASAAGVFDALGKSVSAYKGFSIGEIPLTGIQMDVEERDEEEEQGASEVETEEKAD
jgi:predicted molibdopterin-dependent oxidoreductase YjgC